MMNIYSIEQIIALAKFTSPIYQELYKDIDTDTPFEQLPVLTNSRLMDIVHAKRPDFVFADGNTHGLIFESSASTGKPKVTLWGQDEWETSTQLLAIYHWRNGLLKDRDRVANLCASAYLSYRIVHSVIENFPGKCSEVPIGCEKSFTELNETINKYECNVLAGVNSTFLGLAWDLLERGQTNTTVERILAGGELLYGSQLDLIKQAFPHSNMVSFMFGTTESGIIGYSELTDPIDVFRRFPGISIVEIIDEETNAIISMPGKIGKCVVTSLLRVAAPAIRIDTGDYATWLDDASNTTARFKILGRKFPFHHQLLNAKFNETDVWTLIKKLELLLPITKCQVELHHDRVEIVYSLLNKQESNTIPFNSIVEGAAKATMPMLIDKEIPINCRLVDFAYFLETTRGKGRLIKDCR
jgi:phenylacetate-CoA ligase